MEISISGISAGDRKIDCSAHVPALGPPNNTHYLPRNAVYALMVLQSSNHREGAQIAAGNPDSSAYVLYCEFETTFGSNGNHRRLQLPSGLSSLVRRKFGSWYFSPPGEHHLGFQRRPLARV